MPEILADPRVIRPSPPVIRAFPRPVIHLFRPPVIGPESRNLNRLVLFFFRCARVRASPSPRDAPPAPRRPALHHPISGLVACTKGSASGACAKKAATMAAEGSRECRSAFAADNSKQQQNRRADAGTLYAVAVAVSVSASSTSPLASTTLARSRSRSFPTRR
jgi:hypothetical protein